MKSINNGSSIFKSISRSRCINPQCLFSFQMRAEPHREAAQMDSVTTSPSRPAGLSRERPLDESLGGNSEAAQPSHYLYVPNNAGRYATLWKLSTRIYGWTVSLTREVCFGFLFVLLNATRSQCWGQNGTFSGHLDFLFPQYIEYLYFCIKYGKVLYIYKSYNTCWWQIQ